MRPLRWLAVLTLLALALVWSAPALWVAWGLPGLAERAGGSVELESVRPAFPFGVSIGRARLARAGRTLELADVAARAAAGGFRLDARIGAGSVLVRTDGLSMRAGFVRARALPLEALDGFVTTTFRLRGIADGVYRFGARAEIEANVRDGAIVLSAPAGMELPFAQLTVSAAREPDGAWKVPFADVRGPPLSATARGVIGADGALALTTEIAELGEPARSGFAMLQLPTGPLPYTAEIGGTLLRPRFAVVSEHMR
jgi:hypothetical protein